MSQVTGAEPVMAAVRSLHAMSTQIVFDRPQYDHFTGELTRTMAVVVRRELAEAGLPQSQVRELTEKIVFNLATMFDGNWVLDYEGKMLEPKVLFRYDGSDDRLIWAEGGSYMHEVMFGYVKEVIAATNEYIPLPALRDEILDTVVLPQIRGWAGELGCSQTFRGVIRVGGRDVDSFGVTDGFWLIKLIVRHTVDAVRDIFRVQALIPKHGGTDFSGFQMYGEARWTGETFRVAAFGATVFRNTIGNEDWS